MAKTRKQLEEKLDELEKKVHDHDKAYFNLMRMYVDIQKELCNKDQKEKGKTLDINARVVMDSWPYSDYHGNEILSELYRIQEGKDVAQISPKEYEVK